MKPSILLSSIPKSGTHLMMQMFPKDWPRIGTPPYMEAVNIVPEVEDGHIVWGHILPRQPILNRTEDWIRLFVCRNFRDTLVSWRHWIDEKGAFIGPPEYVRGGWSEEEYRASDDHLLWLIETVHPYFAEMMNWVRIADYILYYDAIMKDPACEIVQALCSDIGLDFDATVESLRYRGGPTYRRGETGVWQEYFKPHHLAAYDKHWGYLKEFELKEER